MTAGRGRVQSWGGSIDEIRPGDVVWTPPGEKHWYGAAPTTAMTHLSIQEQLSGQTADWMEKVSDEQYQAGVKTEQKLGALCGPRNMIQTLVSNKETR